MDLSTITSQLKRVVRDHVIHDEQLDHLAPSMRFPWYVYVASCQGPLRERYTKIGVARNPRRRISSIQTANPEKVDLYGVFGCETKAIAFSLECETHKKLDDEHIRGEWFNIDPGSALHYVCMSALERNLHSLVIDALWKDEVEEIK